MSLSTKLKIGLLVAMLALAGFFSLTDRRADDTTPANVYKAEPSSPSTNFAQ